MAELTGEHLHILLVGENDAHAELAIRGMHDQQAANRIHPVSDGEQAPDYLFGRGAYTEPVKKPRPNRVLPDLLLPRVDGPEVLRIMKTIPDLLRILVVILTSSDAGSDIAGSCDFPANSSIVKPPDFRTFTKLMKELGLYWHGWNAKPMGD